MKTGEARKRIKQGQMIPVKLSEHERGLIINKTLAGPDLTERLELVLKSESVFTFTFDELDELVGYMPDTLQEKGTLVNSQPLFNTLHAAL